VGGGRGVCGCTPRSPYSGETMTESSAKGERQVCVGKDVMMYSGAQTNADWERASSMVTMLT
jgi:hypothetical protein